MMMHGSHIKETVADNNMTNLDKFLENEKNNNKNEPWSKLDKTARIQKITAFIEIYKEVNELFNRYGKFTKIYNEIINKRYGYGKKVCYVNDVKVCYGNDNLIKEHFSVLPSTNVDIKHHLSRFLFTYK